MAGPDLSVFDKQRTLLDQKNALQQAFLARQLALRQASGSGQLPAPIQIANEIARARQTGDTQRVNDLVTTAKLYDRGIVTDQQGNPIAMQGYAPAIGSIEAVKAGMKSQAEANVDLGIQPQITRAKQDQINQSDLDFKPKITENTDRAKASAERGVNYTKAQSALVSFGQKSAIVDDNIKKARSLISSHPNLSTGYGQIFASVPNSKAGELNNYLSTIKANVGFDQLQTMRDNSPTGGALGGVSENENLLLQAVNGALDPKQTKNLDSNLATIEKLYPQVMQEKQRAFNQDYGNINPIGDNPVAPQSSPAMVVDVNANMVPRVNVTYNGKTLSIPADDLQEALSKGAKRL